MSQQARPGPNARPTSNGRPAFNGRPASSANYVLGVCFALTAMNVMDRQLLAIAASAIQTEFVLSDSQLGLLTGFAFVVMHVAVGIPIAALADRTNRRNLIAMGLVLWSVLTAATGFARTVPHIFAARIGVGVGEAVGSGPLQSLLSDYFPVERRATALAITGAGGNIGAFIALLAGGVLVDQVGWRLTFILFGAPVCSSPFFSARPWTSPKGAPRIRSQSKRCLYAKAFPSSWACRPSGT